MNIVKSLFNWLTGQQFIAYLGGGGGGGGSPPPPAPTQSSVYQTNIPEYAQPYVESMLGSAQQQIYNYDASGHPTGIKPYQPFSQDPSKYFAGFSPMQEQGFSTVANMQAGPQGFQRDVGAYMSPFIQNAVAAQEREAARQSQIQGLGQQAQATQAGAFGGARDALMRSERERNLANLQSDIAAQGYQSAFANAQNQYNTGFGQQTGLAQLQNQFGGQQQQLEQAKINQQIQNYATAQQYPMMQLANMSNLLRGLPMQATTVQGYQAAPNPLTQLGGLGLTTAGILGKMGAEGGQPKDFKKKKMAAGLADLALMKMQ